MGTHTLTIGSENGGVGSTISHITISLPDFQSWHISRAPFLEHDKRFGEAFEHHCNNGKHYIRTITHLKGADGLAVRLDNQTCVANSSRTRRSQKGLRRLTGLRTLFSRFSPDSNTGTVDRDEYEDVGIDYDHFYDDEDPTCGHVIKNTNTVKKWHRRCVEFQLRTIEKSYLRDFGNQKFYSDKRGNDGDAYSTDDRSDAETDIGSTVCLHDALEIESQVRRRTRRRPFSSRFIETIREEMATPTDSEKSIEDQHMAALMAIRWDKVWKKAKRVSLTDIWKQDPASTSQHHDHRYHRHHRTPSSSPPGGSPLTSRAPTNESMKSNLSGQSSSVYYECLSNDGALSPPPPPTTRPRNSSSKGASPFSPGRFSESSNMRVREPSGKHSPQEFQPPVFEFEYLDEHDPQRTSRPSRTYDPTKHDSLMSDMVKGLSQYSTKAFGQANCHLFVCIPDPLPNEESLQHDLEELTASPSKSFDSFPFPRPIENWREVVQATMDIGWTMTGDDQVGRVPLAAIYDLLVEARDQGKIELIFEAAGRDRHGRPRPKHNGAYSDRVGDNSTGTNAGGQKIPKVFPQFAVDETFPFDPNLKSKAIDDVIERVLDSVQDLSFEALMWMQTYALWICKSMAVRMGQSLDHGVMKDLNWEYVSALDRMTLAIWLLLRLRRNRHASRVYSRVTMMRGDWDKPEVGHEGIENAAAIASIRTEEEETNSTIDSQESSTTSLSPSSSSPPAQLPLPLSLSSSQPQQPQPQPPSHSESTADSQPATSSGAMETPRKQTWRMGPFLYAYNARLPFATKLPKSVDHEVPLRNSSSSQPDDESKPLQALRLSKSNISDTGVSSGNGSGSSSENGKDDDGGDSNDGEGVRLRRAFITTIRPASAYIATATLEDETNRTQDSKTGASVAKKVSFNDDVASESNKDLSVDENESNSDGSQADSSTDEVDLSIRKRCGNFIIEGQIATKKIHRVSNPHTLPDPPTEANKSRTEYFAGLGSQSTKVTAGINSRASRTSLRASTVLSGAASPGLAPVKTDSTDTSVSQEEFDDHLFPSPVRDIFNNLTFSPPQVQSIFVTCSSCPREFEISYLQTQEHMTIFAKHVAQCSQPSPQSRLTKVKAALSRVKKQGE
ncbi:hypothetical protein BGX34_003655 [Mortierella sp. NVP85]|nr:hypothetical protein BGX34_003655 [Mortierella sp. NVP85]